MHPLRRASLYLLSPLLPLLLFLSALTYGLVQTVGSSADVKKLLADSGVYTSVVPSLLDQTKSVSTSVGNISTADPEIKQVANQALPPQAVQRDVETAVDSIYAWLNGQVAQPNFRIDLSGSQKAFADNLASVIQTKAASLPVCTTPYTTTSFDIENATCLPYGLSPQTLANQVRNDVNSGQDFISQPTITANDLKGGSQNQPVFTGQWKNLPSRYQKIKKTPYILMILSFLTAVGMVFLSPTWRRGMRHVGWTLAIMGLFLLAVAWALDHTSSSLLQPKIVINNAILQTDIRNLLNSIVQKIDRNYLIFGGAYLVLGLLALLGPSLINRSQPLTETEPSPPLPPAQTPKKVAKRS